MSLSLPPHPETWFFLKSSLYLQLTSVPHLRLLLRVKDGGNQGKLHGGSRLGFKGGIRLQHVKMKYGQSQRYRTETEEYRVWILNLGLVLVGKSVHMNYCYNQYYFCF